MSFECLHDYFHEPLFVLIHPYVLNDELPRKLFSSLKKFLEGFFYCVFKFRCLLFNFVLLLVERRQDLGFDRVNDVLQRVSLLHIDVV